MTNQAKITSVEALGAFRSSLIVFLTKSREALDSAGDEVRRVRQWVISDQKLRWEGELRRRSRLLDLAQQEYFSARLSGLRDSTTTQEQAVAKAKQAVAEAEEKLRNVKRWARDFEPLIEPLAKKMQGLRQVLDGDMPHALAYLMKAQSVLEAYAETAPAATENPTPL